jgi:hypothetical protein
LEQSKQGQGRDAEEFFADFEAAHGISNEDHAPRTAGSFQPL